MKRGRSFYITAFVTLLIVAAQGWLRTTFPLVAAAICPCIYNSLGINAGAPVGDPSSGDWQQTGGLQAVSISDILSS